MGPLFETSRCGGRDDAGNHKHLPVASRPFNSRSATARSTFLAAALAVSTAASTVDFCTRRVELLKRRACLASEVRSIDIVAAQEGLSTGWADLCAKAYGYTSWRVREPESKKGRLVKGTGGRDC